LTVNAKKHRKKLLTSWSIMKETSSWSGIHLFPPNLVEIKDDISILEFKEEAISARRKLLYKEICFDQISLEKGGWSRVKLRNSKSKRGKG
jgi:hypothetical protein